MFAEFLNNIILYPFFIVSVRLSGIFLTVPPLSDKAISIKIRITALVLISLALAPVLSKYIPVQPEHISELVIVILKELLIGILLGIGVKLFLLAVNIAGDIMAATMGLQSASLLDPSTNVNSTALARLLVLIATVSFLVLGFHLYMIRAFVESYELIKFNTTLDPGAIMMAIINTVTQVMILAVKMASPVLAANFIINISLGVLNRLVPQVHVFFISMPLTMITGVFILVLSIASMLILFTEEIENNMIIFAQEIQ